MITAHGTREVINRATQTGVSSVVLKPFTPTELARGVAAATASSTPSAHPPNPSADSQPSPNQAAREATERHAWPGRSKRWGAS